MTGPTQDSSPHGATRRDGWPRRPARASWRLAVCALLGAFLLACGEGSGGGSESAGGGGNDPSLATEPVDLPPGQTVAQLAWEPSAGNVSSYMVFLSRNNGSFDFDQTVPESTVAIAGAAGDAVQIVVLAVGADGSFSEGSHPSVPIRFHPALEVQVAANGSTTPAPPTGGMSGGMSDGSDAGEDAGAGTGSNPAPDSPAADASAPPADNPADAGSPPPVDTGTPAVNNGDDAAAEAVDPPMWTPTLRRSLLLANVRQPLAGLGTGASAWLKSQLASGLTTDAVLIATAARSADSLRDLVWQDAAGRLFLAEAEQFAEAENPESTLVAAIQLREGEHFVDLIDLDGDGARDWIVEDPATGAVWLRSGDGTTDRAARAPELPETARLLGSADFDGDGQSELLWQHDDHSLALARPSSTAPLLVSGTHPPLGSQIVALADLTGDGLDDLIARNEEGLLALGLASIDAATGGVAIEWSEGHREADASVELVATVDLDGDGRAELAWRVGENVEIRALGETTPRVFEF